MRSSGPAIGAVAAAAGAAAGHLVAAWLDPATSPVSAVGTLLIDLAPMPVKEFAVATLGAADKPVLIAGVALMALVLGAVAGGIWRHSHQLAAILLATLGLFSAGAVVARPGTTASGVLPGLTAGAVAVGVLFGLNAWVEQAGLPLSPSVDPSDRATLQPDQPGNPAADPGSEPVGPVDRRRLLVGSGVVLAASAGMVALGEQLGRPPAPAIVLPPAPPGTPLPGDLGGVAPGITPLRTPLADFYRVDIALGVPRVDPRDWRLVIDGMADAPYSLTFAELIALPLVERDITLTCVSNPVGGPYCGSTRWRGVLVADLIRRARPRREADMVLSSSPDGFSASTPLPVLLDGRDAMIAVAMDGQPLSPIHGAPARLLTPGLYGYVGATKWLTRMKITRFDADQAYWTPRGWAMRAPVKTAARIDTPRSAAKSGPTPIAGVAWATHRGISRVEVQVDGGAWQTARLGPDAGLDYWRQWYLPWDATAGRHTLTARAFDGAGQVQTEQPADPAPDGASGYHSVSVTVA